MSADVTLIDVPATTVLTGAAGWFGRAALDAWTGDGPWRRDGRIVCLVRDPVEANEVRAALAAARPDIDLESAVVIGDVRSPADIDELLGGLDEPFDVVHAAGVIHPTSHADFHAVNTDGTRTIAEAVRRHGARRMVHISSNSPFGTNSDPADRFGADEPYRPYLGYGESKMEAELAVLDEVELGLNAVIVRPPWFYGPHQPARQTEFFTMVRTGRFPLLGDGSQMRSMTYIDNLVQGVTRAELVPTEPGRGWWIADARPYWMSEIVDSVRDALTRAGYDVKPQRLRLPAMVGNVAEAVDRRLQALGRYQQQVHVLGELNKNIACDITAAVAELGYAPEIEIAEGMYRSVVWCQQQGFEL